MDPLTHTAVGLFLSRAGLNRWTPRAAPLMMLAANAPDIDALSVVGGPAAYLHYHRHLAHSLAAMPVVALLPVLIVAAASRKPLQWRGAYCAALIGVASHLALDLTNAYGIRLLLPFSGEWQHLDFTGVIDPWIWAVLLLGIMGPFIARLVGSEINSGAARERFPGKRFAVFALAFLLLYDCGRYTLHARAVATLESRLYAGSVPLRVAALPTLVNPWRWRGLAETTDFYALADLTLGGDFDPSQALILHKPDPDPALDAARRTPVFREFVRFSRFPLWRVSPAEEPENSKLVEASDLRFGTPQAPGLLATAVVDSKLRVLSTSLRWGLLRPLLGSFSSHP